MLLHVFRYGLIASALFAAIPSVADAGLYLSGETHAALPSQWRGYLSDLRILRNAAVKPTAGTVGSPLREEYEARAKKLMDASRVRELNAEELADLGALHVRLGDPKAAIDVLRPAARAHPRQFAIQANLGTAWQVHGEWESAAECLRLAVELAPDALRSFEQLHLRLADLRAKQPKGEDGLDDLFGVRFENAKGEFAAGQLAEAQKKKLPPDAVALTQRLALALPTDGRLLWQLAELANAHGDVRQAAQMFDFCVSGFGLSVRTLRAHRAAVRALVAEWDKKDPHGVEATRLDPKEHAAPIAFKSKRPLIPKKFDTSVLPPINPNAANAIPWALLAETAMEQKFRPGFPQHLKDLDGLRVSVVGFMQPVSDDLAMAQFLLVEYPTGCWYCEMPEATGMVFVALADGETAGYTRNIVKITGKLTLNAADPEHFLFTLKDAKVTEVD